MEGLFYILPLPTNQQELKHKITAVAMIATQNLQPEADNQLDIWCVTGGVHIKKLW